MNLLFIDDAEILTKPGAGGWSWNAPASHPVPELGAAGHVAPSISGTAVQGRMLTASPGTWSSPYGRLRYAYQWKSCPTSDTSTGCTDVATTGRYWLQDSDVGSYLTMTVTVTDAEAEATQATATPVQVTA